jgi:hypothetical protein
MENLPRRINRVSKREQDSPFLNLCLYVIQVSKNRMASGLGLESRTVEVFPGQEQVKELDHQ